MFRLICLGLIVITPAITFANPKTNTKNQYLNAFLNRFSTNPKLAMNEIPAKFNQDGQIIIDDLAPQLEASDIQNKSFVDKKDSLRKKLCPDSQAGGPCVHRPKLYSDFGSNDRVEFFFPGRHIEKSPEKLFATENLKVRLAENPWSGDYWATYRMGIAQRYEDESYPFSTRYEDYYNFFSNAPEIDVTNQAQLDLLSPAEKYDLLLGDTQGFTMTTWNILNGKIAYSDGKAETWFGICHGWAPASYMVARPHHQVSFPISETVNLNFYPHDIKALATQLWANAPVPTRFLGGRCNNKDPDMDDSGRILNPECFDINPAAWHIALVNEVGIARHGMVLDATYDFEVWNQPIRGYEVVLFNPETKQVAQDLNSATTSIENFKSDNFVKYRSPRAKKIFGVSLRLTYMVESQSYAAATDDESKDVFRTVNYIYDIELSDAGEMLGGEWYQNAHPDFIWTPTEGASPKSVGDAYLTEAWQAGFPPESWQSGAKQASFHGQPLAGVVERLVDLSNPRR